MPACGVSRDNRFVDIFFNKNRFGRAIINGFPVCNKVYFLVI
jgi:hypothetical protein